MMCWFCSVCSCWVGLVWHCSDWDEKLELSPDWQENEWGELEFAAGILYPVWAAGSSGWNQRKDVWVNLDGHTTKEVFLWSMRSIPSCSGRKGHDSRCLWENIFSCPLRSAGVLCWGSIYITDIIRPMISSSGRSCLRCWFGVFLFFWSAFFSFSYTECKIIQCVFLYVFTFSKYMCTVWMLH